MFTTRDIAQITYKSHSEVMKYIRLNKIPHRKGSYIKHIPDHPIKSLKRQRLPYYIVEDSNAVIEALGGVSQGVRRLLDGFNY